MTRVHLRHRKGRKNRSERLLQALLVKEPVRCFHYQVPEGDERPIMEMAKDALEALAHHLESDEAVLSEEGSKQ